MTAEPTGVRSFPLAVVLSLTTERLLWPTFSEVQELADHVAGSPVFTHMLGDRSFVDRLQAAIREQHPWTADVHVPEVDAKGLEYLAAISPWLDGLIAEYGPTLPIRRGLSGPTENPVASLARMMGGGDVR